ncbi:MAG: hypothetical protein PHV36_07075 [Elusimicrobiales bacterium]|nr:hypothetical protein [Elusimicrobiales bacterium]
MIKEHKSKKVITVAEVFVNYPQQKECITGSEYAFRIEAGTAGRVEISIDNKEWQPCRRAGGYWWYDWSGYLPGNHVATARCQTQDDGHKPTSGTVHFRVQF